MFKLSIQHMLMNLFFFQSKVLTTSYNTKITQKHICLGSLLQMTSLHPDTKTKSNRIVSGRTLQVTLAFITFCADFLY